MTRPQKLSRRTAYPALIGFVVGSAVTGFAVVIVLWTIRADDVTTWNVHQDFTKNAAGTPDRAESGQLWSVSSNGARGAMLKIVDGGLTNTAEGDGPAAGYLSVDLGKPVAAMTSSYEFSERSSNGGAVGMLVRTDMPPPVPVGEFQLTSPAHLAIGREQMDFGVANDGKIEIIGSAKFDPPLQVEKVYETTVELDVKHGIARVDGPDGRTYVYADPRIMVNRGNVASFEVYQQNAVSDDRPAITSVGTA